MKSTYSEIKIQDTSLRLGGARIIELPVVRRSGTRASKGIPREGTLFFSASRDTEDLFKRVTMRGAQAIFISRDADFGVNR